MPDGFLLSIDFEKACNTITFEHAPKTVIQTKSWLGFRQRENM